MSYLDELRKEQKLRDEAGSMFFFTAFVSFVFGGATFLTLKGAGVNEDLSGGIAGFVGLVVFLGLLVAFAWAAVKANEAKEKEDGEGSHNPPLSSGEG